MTSRKNRITREWVEKWAATYPSPEDEPLASLAHRPSFGTDESRKVIEWKNSRQWRAKQLSAFGKNAPASVEDLTRRAFACDDELAALLLVDALDGVGPATGSAFLMAHDPERYTVMDPRARSSLEAFGILGSAYPGEGPGRQRQWTTYLQACRAVALDVGTALRQLDRALFQAKGRSALPGVQGPES